VSVCLSVYMCLSVCSASKLDDLLTPAPLSDKSLENHTIFRVPIAIVPGKTLNSSSLNSLLCADVPLSTYTLTHSQSLTTSQHSVSG